MWGRLLIALLVIFGAWYFLTHQTPWQKKEIPASSEKGEVALSDCFLYADRANSSLAAAAAMAGRPPVDSIEWFRVESDSRQAISAAESACAGSADAAKALVLMRTSLAELASAARGEGGATGLAARQGEIDDLLNRARGR
jgi:hypothetical protein